MSARRRGRRLDVPPTVLPPRAVRGIRLLFSLAKKVAVGGAEGERIATSLMLLAMTRWTKDEGRDDVGIVRYEFRAAAARSKNYKLQTIN